MTLKLVTDHDETLVEACAPGVELILSALDAGTNELFDRRAAERLSYRAVGRLTLWAYPDRVEPFLIYVRDADVRGLGFVTQHRLPLGYGGRVVVESPAGETLDASCSIYRCRECAPDWYEGAISFNRNQPAFALKRARARRSTS